MSKSAVIKMAYENNGIVTSSMVSEAKFIEKLFIATC